MARYIPSRSPTYQPIIHNELMPYRYQMWAVAANQAAQCHEWIQIHLEDGQDAIAAIVQEEARNWAKMARYWLEVHFLGPDEDVIDFTIAVEG